MQTLALFLLAAALLPSIISARGAWQLRESQETLCEKVADILHGFIAGHSTVEIHQTVINVQQLSHLAHGVDLFDPAEMRRVVCRVLDAENIGQIVEAWDELGIGYSETRFLYDAIAVMWQLYGQFEHNFQRVSNADEASLANNVVNLHLTLDEIGFFALDPEGVQRFRESGAELLLQQMGFIPASTTLYPAGTSTLDSSEKCSRVGEALGRLLATVEEEAGNQWPMITMQVELYTGNYIPLGDVEAMTDFVCEVTGGDSVRDIYDALLAHDLSRPLAFWFPLLAQQWSKAIQRIEKQPADELSEDARAMIRLYELLHASRFLSLTAR